MTAAAPTAAAATAPVAAWRDVVVLLKLRIAALVVAVALAAAVAAGERSAVRLAALAAAALAAASGAGALNHVFDRALDRRMARTATRPVAAGRLDARVALALGWGLVAASLLALPVLGLLVSAYLVAGSLTYALVYTRWLKPRTPYSIVWGGAAGSFAAFAGWQLGATTFAIVPVLLAVVLFLWTPTHFWSLAIALEDDYRAAGVPMLPVLAGRERTARAVLANTVALALAASALAALLAWPYALVAVPSSSWFLWKTLRLAREPTHARARGVFKLSGLYLLLLLVGLAATALA